MPHSLLVRILAATLLVSACSSASSNSSARDERTSKTSSADGTLAPAVQQPQERDTISSKADAGRIAGDAKATIWVVMASDFQCPFCKSWHDAAFQTVLKNYVSTGRVRMAFLNVPLSIHANSVVAAEAAMCASVQNKFWPMHEALFATQAKWETLRDPTAMFDSLATSLGVTMPAWRQCYSQHLTRALIQADHDRATSSGVGSTPTFFVGSQMLSGADADVKGAIEAALAKAGKK